jgi:hypothetical protein
MIKLHYERQKFFQKNLKGCDLQKNIYSIHHQNSSLKDLNVKNQTNEKKYIFKTLNSKVGSLDTLHKLSSVIFFNKVYL